MYKYRVCVADDCPEAASVLCEGLRLHNYDVEVAYNGETALEICAQGNIDLILLDVCMPDIDGFEVCKRLKSSPATSRIPVIFVTVKGSAQDISRGREAGGTDHIIKPYNLPMVMLRVDAALRGVHVEDRLGVQNDLLFDSVYTDQLTGLRTRRYFLGRLQEEVEKAHRHDFPVSCAVFDLDDMVALDEELGMAELDNLLIEIAIMMRNQARTCDILARCDCSEFAAVLPHASLTDAVAFASRIVEEVSRTTFSHPTCPTQAVLCAGIVTCQRGFMRGADYVFSQAMCRLLEAKSLSTEHIVARDLVEPPSQDGDFKPHQPCTIPSQV